MTAQVPETLYCEGQQLAMCCEPLELYFERIGKRPDFVAPHTVCWR